MTRLVADSKNMNTMVPETPGRKVNKQIMERKRRVRINSCLSELKLLVLQAMKKDTSQFTKMEKADILDMTVEYLRCLQKRHYMLTAANNPSSVSTYRAGFNQCAAEILRYCGDQSLMKEDVRVKMMDYLSDSLQAVNVNSGRNSKLDNKPSINIPQTSSVMQTPDSPMSQSSGSSNYDSQSSPSPSYSSEHSCSSPTPDGAFTTHAPQQQLQTVPGVYVNVPVVYQLQVPEQARNTGSNQEMYSYTGSLNTTETATHVQNLQSQVVHQHCEQTENGRLQGHMGGVGIHENTTPSQYDMYRNVQPSHNHLYSSNNSQMDINNNTVECDVKSSYASSGNDFNETNSVNFRQFSAPIQNADSESVWRPW